MILGETDPMKKTRFQVIFQELDRMNEGAIRREEHELPGEFLVEELDEIDELRRLSLSLKTPEVRYFTRT